MRFRRYSIVLLVSALMVTLTERSSIAFSIIPAQPGATSHWKPVSPYVAQDIFGNLYDGQTEVDMKLWTEPLPVGGSFLFNSTLLLWSTFSDRGFFGWDFKRAQQELMGSFEITHYLACGTQDLCGLELPGLPDIRSGEVGAAFYLKYLPAPIDPQPGQGKLHWIQMVRANYGGGLPGLLPGVPFIDNGLRRNDPYYDTTGEAGEDYLLDRPYNSTQDASTINNYFEAELYLVEETTSPGNFRREVTIYNGIKWGWRNIVTPRPTKTFSGTLASGYQQDQYKLEGLTPGNYFYAWTNNDIPSNRCNPNTYLSASSGSWYNSDNDSSFIGDGYASALAGIVSDDGTINFNVYAANGGRRGEDKGSYELNVKVYERETTPQAIIAGSSGGGGVVFERPRPGNTQQNPILPTTTTGGWQIFNNVPSCRWYDPPHNYGFEFQALEDTLFTEILDFPVGLDNRFTVSVGNNILGEFSPGDSLDFVSLLGYGVPNFKITGIEAFIGSTPETAFPIQLAFNNKVGSFQMRPFSELEPPTPQQVLEPGSAFGLLVLGAFGGLQKLKNRNLK